MCFGQYSNCSRTWEELMVCPSCLYVSTIDGFDCLGGAGDWFCVVCHTRFNPATREIQVPTPLNDEPEQKEMF